MKSGSKDSVGGIPPMTPQKGWVVEEVFSRKKNSTASTYGKDSVEMAVDMAPTLQALRTKLSGNSDSSGLNDAAAEVRFGKLASKIDVVRVKPEQGGASKVAFRDKDGNIEIMQG